MRVAILVVALLMFVGLALGCASSARALKAPKPCTEPQDSISGLIPLKYCEGPYRGQMVCVYEFENAFGTIYQVALARGSCHGDFRKVVDYAW